MVDRLEAMAILRMVVEKGSFTAAAGALAIPLPSVSRKIGELETYLGTRLLTRSTRKLSLTDAGLAYVEAARRILTEVEEAERAAAGEYLAPRGELVVTAPILFGRLHMLPIVTDFLAAYPDINVRLLLSDRNVHLIEDQVDLGVRIGKLSDSDLIATRVGSMRTIVCGAASLLGVHRTPLHPADLQALPCVSFDRQAPATNWTFRDPRSGNPIHVPITPRLSTTTAEVAVTAAACGTGITRVYAYQAEDAVRSNRLEIILSEFEVDPVPVHLIHAGRDLLPLKTRVFLTFATSRLQETLA